MNVGDELDAVIFDGIFEEYGMWDEYEEKKAYYPEDILQYNHCKIRYKGGWIWDITMDYGGTFEHPIHVNVEHLNTGNRWVALNNEMIHITKEIRKIGERLPPGRRQIHKHISEFGDHIRAGWRGPIMLWEKVKEMPKIYWHFTEVD